MRRRRADGRVTSFAVGAAFAVLLAARGHLVPALLVALVSGVLAQARFLAPAFDAAFTDGLARIGQGVGRTISALLLGGLFVLVVVPVSALAMAARRPLGGSGAAQWSPRRDVTRARRTFVTGERARSAASGRRRQRALVAAGLVLVVLVVDVAAGSLLAGTHLLEPADRGDLRRLFIDLESQQRAARPEAWASEPFAADLDAELVEFQLTGGDTHDEPFLGSRVHPFDGQYVNTTDEERVSYEPAVSTGADPLRVAFFGGSVMFGMGQRDDHTIPSEFARVAEEHGVAVEVHNYGLPRWVAWQELLYLERLLARDERYDLAIFLDGYNEFAVQVGNYATDPTHYTASALAELAEVAADTRSTEPGFFDGLDELVDTYHRNSAIWRVVDDVRGVRAPLPGASVTVTATPEEQTAAALDVYGRATALVGDLAQAHDLPVRFFWQPREGGWPDDVLDGLPEEVGDLSHVFDGEASPIYYDGIHTNEGGARLLAEALWAAVRDDLTRT